MVGRARQPLPFRNSLLIITIIPDLNFLLYFCVQRAHGVSGATWDAYRYTVAASFILDTTLLLYHSSGLCSNLYLDNYNYF